MSIANNLLAIQQQKLNIKAAIQRKLGGTDIGMDLSDYPSYIRQIKSVTPVEIDSFTGSSSLDKCNYINYLKGEIASAIQDCDVNGFDPNDLSQYTVAINQIRTGSTPVVHTLAIEGPSETSGETCSFTGVYDGLTNISNLCTWSIISGATYASISNGELTIDSSASAANVSLQIEYDSLTATKDITVTYKSGTVTETQTTTVSDESGNTTTVTTTVVTNEDGSSSSNSTTVNYDDEGNTTGSIENTTNVNSDGSSNSTTTNYDENGDPESQVNNDVDVDGNSSTQNIEYDSGGTPVVVGYEIDTSGSQEGTKEFNEDGVNTEFYGFDAVNGFVLEVHFKIDFAHQPAGQNEGHHNVITMKRATPSPWYGFQLRQSNTNKYVQLGTQFASGSNTNTTINPSNMVNNVGEYNLRVTYNPSLSTNSFVCYNLITSANVYTSNLKFPDIPELRYLTVCIGYAQDENGDPYRYSNIEVLNFSLSKIPSN